ncbi:MAG TPA: hypothetical protein VF062_02130, partial [Candidatus Limnocylindrales bacterium]
MTVQAGDRLLVASIAENAAGGAVNTAPTGGGQTYTQLATLGTDANNSRVIAWSCTASSSQTFSVSAVRPMTDTSPVWGVVAWVYRNSDGFGAVGAPTVGSTSNLATFTTQAANSAVLVVSGDWDAIDGTTRTRRTVNSATGAEETYFRDSAAYTVYASRYDDAGAAGSISAGYSAPAGQQSAMIAVEIKGTTVVPDRYYLTSDTPSYTPATVRGTWNDTALSANVYELGAFKAGVSTAVARAETSATNPYKVLLTRHVSEPLTGGSVTTSDGITHTQARLESNAAMNATVQIAVWVTVGNTDTVRGWLLDPFAGATEFNSTALTAFSYSLTFDNPVTIQSGDRVVVELGYTAAQTATTSYTGTIQIGGTAGDLATSGTTGVTTNSPWITFTGTNRGAFVPLAGPTNYDGSAALSVTAAVAADATVARATDAARAVTAATVSTGATGLATSAAVTPVATISATGARVVATSAALAVTAATTATGSANLAKSASLTVTAAPSATGVGARSTTSALAVSAAVSGAGSTNTVGTAGLAISAAISATGAVALSTSAALSVSAAISSSGVAVAGATAALDVTAT